MLFPKLLENLRTQKERRSEFPERHLTHLDWLSVTDAGVDDFANVPKAGSLPGRNMALSFITVGQLRRVATAVQTLDIQAPAVFFLDQAGAVAEGAIKQFHIFK